MMIAEAARLAALQEGTERDLRQNILPFWLERVLDRRVGFHGQIDDHGVVDPLAPMGGVLCARLLWTFAAALRHTGDSAHERAADHFFAWLTGPFWDESHGGIYWMLDHAGHPVDLRKQTYALAFAVYALAEYSLATGSEASLQRAIALFRTIEAHAAEPVGGGYQEARARDWTALADMRLSDRDQNAPKSMNTHLHLMEAYANLLRAWPDPGLRQRLRELVILHLDRIVDPASGHLVLFFDDAWAPLSRAVSFGHDIEASWLLTEAAEVTADAGLHARARAAGLRLARVTLAEGEDRSHGGIFAERREDGSLDDDKHWWMQAEAVVGFLNAWELSGDEEFLLAAERAWSFIDRWVVDRAHGEWRWRTLRSGTPVEGLPKVEPWKCPYHNSRAALQVQARAAQRTR